MEAEKLMGLFVLGTTRGGGKFLGIVTGYDDTFIYMEHRGSKKLVMISEIIEMKAEPVKEGLQ